MDLIVSRYTFIHLRDPAGTFLQAYNQLRPKTGLIFTDGFHTYDPDTPDYDSEALTFLKSTKKPFVLNTYIPRETLICRGTGTYPFLLKRSDATPCLLPMTYEPYNEVFLWGVPLDKKEHARYSQSNSSIEETALSRGGYKEYFLGTPDLIKWLSHL